MPYANGSQMGILTQGSEYSHAPKLTATNSTRGPRNAARVKYATSDRECHCLSNKMLSST